MSNETQSDSRTPATATPLDPMAKAGILQAVAQLDTMLTAFQSAFSTASPRVLAASKEFSEALKEWANNA